MRSCPICEMLQKYKPTFEERLQIPVTLADGRVGFLIPCKESIWHKIDREFDRTHLKLKAIRG